MVYTVSHAHQKARLKKEFRCLRSKDFNLASRLGVWHNPCRQGKNAP